MSPPRVPVGNLRARLSPLRCSAALIGLAAAGAALGGDLVLDATYGTGGVTALSADDILQGGNFGYIPFPPAIAVLEDGSVLFAGTAPDRSMRMLKIAPDGRPDRQFGVGGRVALPLAAASGGSSPGVAIQRNGQIVVAGAAPSATSAVGAVPSVRARVVRLHPDGTLDSRFGDDGFAEHPVPGAQGPSRSVRVALDSAERIHVVASCDPLDGYSLLRCAARSWRLLADGQPDAGFVESAMPVPVEGGAYPLAIATMVDGSSFVLVEEPFDIMDNSERLVRILADGGVDRAFANPTLTRQMQAILAWDGGLYVSQLVESSDGVHHGAIVRLDSQGATDRSFGAQGSFGLASVSVLGDSPLYMVALAGDGPHALIASGAALPTTLAPPDTLITRVTDQGVAAIDAAFGREGFARLGLGVAFYNGQAVRRDASGRLIVAGLTSTRVATGLPRAARLSETAASPGDSPGVFALSDNGASLRESGGLLRLYVTRGGGARGPASLEYETVSGSAVEGSDFIATRGRLDWADGDSSEREVQIRLIDDAVAEPSEAFWVALRNPVGARLLANESVWIYVLDDDAAGGATGSGSPTTSGVSASATAAGSGGGGGAAGAAMLGLLGAWLVARFRRPPGGAGQRPAVAQRQPALRPKRRPSP